MSHRVPGYPTKATLPVPSVGTVGGVDRMDTLRPATSSLVRRNVAISLSASRTMMRSSKSGISTRGSAGSFKAPGEQADRLDRGCQSGFNHMVGGDPEWSLSEIYNEGCAD